MTYTDWRGYFFVFGILGLSMSCSVWAGNPKLPYGPTALELAALPDYCQARIGKDPAKMQLWKHKMGRLNFSHLHHYCFALNFLNRASKVVGDKNLKRRYYGRAVGDFNYVLKRWKSSFPLYKQAQIYKDLAVSMSRLQ